jgi:hypothetical protein
MDRPVCEQFRVAKLIGHLTNYGQNTYFWTGHFHTEVNPEVIPNPSQRAAKI